MKKIYSYFLLAILSIVWSCDEKENMDPVGDWKLNAPVLALPANNASITLDAANPDANTKFEWNAATTTNKFVVQYSVVLVEQGSTDYNNPILKLTPANNARALSVNATASQIDYALWAACYEPGEVANLQWVVIAKSIDKQEIATQNISIQRFETEYIPTTLFITGEATEGGSDLSKAIEMRAHQDAEGNYTGRFDVYTHLEEGKEYFFRDQANEQSRKIGGSEGVLTCGSTIAAPVSGEYRVTADLVNNTFSLLPIDRWSLVGDAVEGGWGGDVPLTYVGNGIWEKEVMFYQPYDGAGWIFRANGDWGYLLKRVKGTATPDNKGGEVIMESEAGGMGLQFEDMPGTTGLHKVTLDLSTGNYTYKLTKLVVPVETIIGKATNLTTDAVSGVFPIQAEATPAELYLLEDGTLFAQLTKDGEMFTTNGKYLALQAGKTYSLNSSADGTGVVYDGDDDGEITVDHDQAYSIKVDFSKNELTWKHYNLKLFHWDEVPGGWDQRQELLMTYTHPYKFDVTGNLFAGYHSKFISPWEVQFGTSSTALSGTMTNGGENYKGIISNGTYKASITVSDDYSTAEYSFVKQ